MASTGRVIASAAAPVVPRACCSSKAAARRQLCCQRPFLSGSAVVRTAALRPATAAVRGDRGAPLRCNAVLTVRDDATGVEFPLVNNFWAGDTYRSLGAGARTKKIAFIGVKVYAVTLYVEAEKAARELGIRNRGGFFESDDDYCIALADGAFSKLLQIEMARKVEGGTFVEALEEALAPRMRLMGESSILEQFKVFFMNRTLEKGTNVLLMWHQPDMLEVVVTDDKGTDFTRAVPELALKSPGLCRALFEVYLGSSSVVPDAKSTWAAGARKLIESDDIRRADRKSGA